MNESQKTPIEKLGLSNSIQRYLENANIETVEELCELPIDIVYEMCNKEITVIIGILKKLETMFM